jgi:putative transposase
MKRLQAYKYELQPNGEQQRKMRRFSGACRFVFNKALGWQSAQYASDKTVKFSYTDLANMLPTWKLETATGWLKESPSQTLQQTLKDLERAYKNFFEKRTDFPRFKKKGQSDSFRYPQGCRLDQVSNRIFLPKLGWVRYRNSRGVLGVVKNVTVSGKQGKWFVSIQTERKVEVSPHTSVTMVGIDVGITRFATVSDGEVFEPQNYFRKHESSLARAQKSLSRKKKFSNNWKKEKAKVQQLHMKIGNSRRDYLHKVTTLISKKHAIVCLEDLKVCNMSKSASGTIENPGKNVRAKSGLNKAILDQGWSEFRRQLAYKMDWRGGQLILVAPHNTSRTCPSCSHVSGENRKTQSKFLCVSCGYNENADLVGATNILRAGHAQLACADTASVRMLGQEPTEGIQALCA